MAMSPAGSGSGPVEEKKDGGKKGEEEKLQEEKLQKKHSHANDEAEAKASEKHLAPPADQASDQARCPSPPPCEGGKSEHYPGGIRLFIIIVALILSVFLVCMNCRYRLPFPLRNNEKLIITGHCR
jgi:hypothetical protein